MKRPNIRPFPCLAAAALAASVLVPPTVPGAEAPPPPAPAPDLRQQEQRLSFQTSGPWSPRVQLNADVAMVYGIDPTLPGRVESWRKRGYAVQVMTGVSWGHYEDYLHGRWDGKDHQDERQTDRSGNPLQHGLGGDVWYMSPGEAYGKYLSEGVARALDAGAGAVYLEEPEFWVRGGWEPNFRREWQAYYGEAWQPPDASPDAQYRASKLKYFLYRRTLSQVFESVRRYAKEHPGRGPAVPCYVPTHSLLNYAHWRIVSPESSLLDVGCDGYIAQVWTGTSRTPNVYENRLKERTFETAFLEYGAMQNLVRASGRRVWYLNDPVEDNPRRTWADYRANWENTLTASLLQPEVWRYEIMPWPQRVFDGRYPTADPARAGERVGISAPYETELQAVITALGDMKQPEGAVRWESAGTRGAGVLVADTMMFQRGGPSPSDEHLGSFYGLAMPLLKRGLPVEPVQIENVTAPSGAHFLDRYRLLMLTYEGQKPPRPEFHSALAEWVKAGGALVVLDDDKDPYDAVRDWWNAPPMRFPTPRHHLFEALGLAPDARGLSRVGKGAVLYEPLSPAGLTYDPAGASKVPDLARRAAEATGLKWEESPALVLRRGPYVVAAGLDETPAAGGKEGRAAGPLVLRGRFVPLFDPELPVVGEFAVEPGRRALLLDLSALPEGKEGVVAAACRVRDEAVTPTEIRFRADGVEGSGAVVRVRMAKAPASAAVGGAPLKAEDSDYADGTLRLRFRNAADGVDVVIRK